MTETLYRYQDHLEGDEYSSHPRIVLYTYPVVKRTPKGYWIGHYKRRFVLDSGKKRYAHPTKEEALESFIHRKRRQKLIYASRHDTAAEVLGMAEAMRDGRDPHMLRPLTEFAA